MSLRAAHFLSGSRALDWHGTHFTLIGWEPSAVAQFKYPCSPQLSSVERHNSTREQSKKRNIVNCNHVGISGDRAVQECVQVVIRTGGPLRNEEEAGPRAGHSPTKTNRTLELWLREGNPSRREIHLGEGDTRRCASSCGIQGHVEPSGDPTPTADPRSWPDCASRRSGRGTTQWRAARSLQPTTHH